MNDILSYNDIPVRMDAEHDTVWLSQKNMATLYGKSRKTITEHIGNVLEEGELLRDSVCRNFRHTAGDGKNYEVEHYNLKMVIAVGFRVKSPVGTRFRIWATEQLHGILSGARRRETDESARYWAAFGQAKTGRAQLEILASMRAAGILPPLPESYAAATPRPADQRWEPVTAPAFWSALQRLGEAGRLPPVAEWCKLRDDRAMLEPRRLLAALRQDPECRGWETGRFRAGGDLARDPAWLGRPRGPAGHLDKTCFAGGLGRAYWLFELRKLPAGVQRVLGG